MDLLSARTRNNQTPTLTIFNLENLAYAEYTPARMLTEDCQGETYLTLTFAGGHTFSLSGIRADAVYKELSEKLPQYLRIEGEAHLKLETIKD